MDKAEVVARTWNRISTLFRYGHEPLTIGWYHGQAYIRIWDYKLGDLTWREFKTKRAEQPAPSADIFNSSWLYERLK